MSEAKLTDIHFLVVLVFCKHPQGLDAPAESLLSCGYIQAVFGCSTNTLSHISRTTKRPESHLGKLAFLRAFPARFCVLETPHYTFPPLNPLSKPQWKMFTAK
jgi:hypothetical protein